MRPKSRPVGNTGLKVLLLILYEVALLEQGGGGDGLCRPPLPLPPHDPVHECTLLFILLLLMLAGIPLNECTRKDSSSGYLSVYSGPSEFEIRNHF